MTHAKTVLIVDDEETARRLLYFALKGEYRVLEAGDADEALRCVSGEEVDLVLLDLHLPPDTGSAAEGIRLEGEIRARRPHLPVVVVTGDREKEPALEMVGRGVADFLVKPIEPEVLRIVVSRALERARLESELVSLRSALRERYSFGNLVGESRVMRRLFRKLERLASSTASVLLLGESGTGKSAVARAIHNGSPREGGPFVVVDGAAIPDSLIESELFGHVRGAYTGAEAAKRGRIEMADGGTLFLDEIGNLSLAAQSKLLLFLDNRSYTPVGSNDEVHVDVRLVAATNEDLGRLVRSGDFRADLLYRIQVATVEIPPLRGRREDIAPLAQHLLLRIGREMNRGAARLTQGALSLLEGYDWPGNVRQLKHVLESSLVLAEGDLLDASDLVLPPPPAPGLGGGKGEEGAPAAGASAPETPSDFKGKVAVFERRLIEDALEKSGGSKAAAGRLLGLDENQIHYLCRKHRIG
ncbi:MAG: sigma-54 dependent transcriptional regulator [Candidatus Eisenbacteria bacterium]